MNCVQFARLFQIKRQLKKRPLKEQNFERWHWGTKLIEPRACNRYNKASRSLTLITDSDFDIQDATPSILYNEKCSHKEKKERKKEKKERRNHSGKP